jgi:hypothetical protein
MRLWLPFIFIGLLSACSDDGKAPVGATSSGSSIPLVEGMQKNLQRQFLR